MKEVFVKGDNIFHREEVPVEIFKDRVAIER